jgi:hypothetical protein
VPLWRRRERQHGVPFLSEEWCRLWADVAHGVPGFDGATANFMMTITLRDGRTESFTVKLVDGVTTGVVAGPVDAPDLVAEFPQDEFARYLRGDTKEVYDAYWVGQIRVTGELEAVAAIAPLLDDARFKAQLREVHDRTAFPQTPADSTER